jgi:hypothetical protein
MLTKLVGSVLNVFFYIFFFYKVVDENQRSLA